MRKKVIESKIINSFSDSVPDVLDNILKVCEKKRGFDEEVNVKKNNEFVVKNIDSRSNIFSNNKLVGVFVSIAVIAVGLIGVNKYNKNRVDSIIEFDVNPSIELKVNREESVINAIPLNEDGKKVLGDMEFENVDLDIAVNAIVGSMIKNGYLTIDENSILVSVKNSNKEKAMRLQEEISKDIDEILKVSNINGSILTQGYDKDKDMENIAKKYDISDGKAKLINRIINSSLKNSKGEKYSAEALSKLSINELNILLNQKDEKVDNVTSNGKTASENTYIGKDKAKSIAFNHAKVNSKNVSDFKIEFDADDGMLVYEIEFKSGNKEYDYEINAKTGVIIEHEIDIEDDD